MHACHLFDPAVRACALKLAASLGGECLRHVAQWVRAPTALSGTSVTGKAGARGDKAGAQVTCITQLRWAQKHKAVH